MNKAFAKTPESPLTLPHEYARCSSTTVVSPISAQHPSIIVTAPSQRGGRRAYSIHQPQGLNIASPVHRRSVRMTHPIVSGVIAAPSTPATSSTIPSNRRDNDTSTIDSRGTHNSVENPISSPSTLSFTGQVQPMAIFGQMDPNFRASPGVRGKIQDRMDGLRVSTAFSPNVVTISSRLTRSAVDPPTLPYVTRTPSISLSSTGCAHPGAHDSTEVHRQDALSTLESNATKTTLPSPALRAIPMSPVPFNLRIAKPTILGTQPRPRPHTVAGYAPQHFIAYTAPLSAALNFSHQSPVGNPSTEPKPAVSNDSGASSEGPAHLPTPKFAGGPDPHKKLYGGVMSGIFDSPIFPAPRPRSSVYSNDSLLSTMESSANPAAPIVPTSAPFPALVTNVTRKPVPTPVKKSVPTATHAKNINKPLPAAPAYGHPNRLTGHIPRSGNEFPRVSINGAEDFYLREQAIAAQRRAATHRKRRIRQAPTKSKAVVALEKLERFLQKLFF